MHRQHLWKGHWILGSREGGTISLPLSLSMLPSLFMIPWGEKLWAISRLVEPMWKEMNENMSPFSDVEDNEVES